MRITGTPLPPRLQRLVGWSPVRGPASRAESNGGPPGRLLRPPQTTGQWVLWTVHVRCFGLAQQPPSLLEQSDGGGSKDRCTGRGGSSVSSALRTTATIASILRKASGGKLIGADVRLRGQGGPLETEEG